MENAKIFSGMHLRHIFQINSRTGNITFEVRRRHCFSLCMKFNSSTICRRVLVFILSCEGELCRGSFHTAINNYFHVVLCRCLIPCSIKCLQTVTNVSVAHIDVFKSLDHQFKTKKIQFIITEDEERCSCILKYLSGRLEMNLQ